MEDRGCGVDLSSGGAATTYSRDRSGPDADEQLAAEDKTETKRMCSAYSPCGLVEQWPWWSRCLHNTRYLTATDTPAGLSPAWSHGRRATLTDRADTTSSTTRGKGSRSDLQKASVHHGRPRTAALASSSSSGISLDDSLHKKESVRRPLTA